MLKQGYIEIYIIRLDFFLKKKANKKRGSKAQETYSIMNSEIIEKKCINYNTNS